PASGILPAPLTQSLAITPLDLFRGYVQSWNVAVQRALPGNFSLEAAYVGNHAVNVRTTYQLNHGLVLGAGRSGQPLFQRFGRQTSTTTYIGTHSYYDGLHVRFDRKFGGGFLLTTSYTYSKAIDFCTDLDCSPYNMFDIRS